MGQINISLTEFAKPEMIATVNAIISSGVSGDIRYEYEEAGEGNSAYLCFNKGWIHYTAGEDDRVEECIKQYDLRRFCEDQTTAVTVDVIIPQSVRSLEAFYNLLYRQRDMIQVHYLDDISKLPRDKLHLAGDFFTSGSVRLSVDNFMMTDDRTSIKASISLPVNRIKGDADISKLKLHVAIIHFTDSPIVGNAFIV